MFGLLRFIVGVLGALLVLGSFFSFVPLFFIGGLASGSVGFAFGFPIFLMVLGSTMIYFGFYYHVSPKKTNPQLIKLLKWWLVNTIAILIGYFITSQLNITDFLLSIFVYSLIVLVIAQIVKSHDGNMFPTRWFLFYYVVYLFVFWLFAEFILSQMIFREGFLSAILIGFSIAGITSVLEQAKIKRNTVVWLTVLLAVLFLVANINNIQLSLSSIPVNTPLTGGLLALNVTEQQRNCPFYDFDNSPVTRTQAGVHSTNQQTTEQLINQSVWTIEKSIDSCYLGRFRGQNPQWFYCDNMIVSRWDLSSSGTINHRWYTAVTAEWSPQDQGTYSLERFSCENGQRVIVDKEQTNYYVHVTRDGREIQIEY